MGQENLPSYVRALQKIFGNRPREDLDRYVSEDPFSQDVFRSRQMINTPDDPEIVLLGYKRLKNAVIQKLNEKGLAPEMEDFAISAMIDLTYWHEFDNDPALKKLLKRYRDKTVVKLRFRK